MYLIYCCICRPLHTVGAKCWKKTSVRLINEFHRTVSYNKPFYKLKDWVIWRLSWGYWQKAILIKTHGERATGPVGLCCPVLCPMEQREPGNGPWCMVLTDLPTLLPRVVLPYSEGIRQERWGSTKLQVYSLLFTWTVSCTIGLQNPSHPEKHQLFNT